VTKKATYALMLLAIAGALSIAGCGGGGSSTGSTEAEPQASGGSGEEVFTAEVNGLGTVLTNGEGQTVYIFRKDKGEESACYGECASFWPALTTKGAPTGAEGAETADLGTIERKDGTMQVTYKGHPLYTFITDEAPGEAAGNEFEGLWFAVDTTGEAVKGAPVSAANPSEGSGSGAYGY
jgi:predicted lipoprotein with Yx(FWY)xxD motif